MRARRMTFGLSPELREARLHVCDPDGCSRPPILLVGVLLSSAPRHVPRYVAAAQCTQSIQAPEAPPKHPSANASEVLRWCSMCVHDPYDCSCLPILLVGVLLPSAPRHVPRCVAAAPEIRVNPTGS